MPEGKYARVFDALRSGEPPVMQAACEEVARSWKDIPVEPLLALKSQFAKMGLEHREAHLEEAIASVAEKRPEPFAAIVKDPENPLWRPSVEVAALTGAPRFLDIFLELAPSCPRRCRATLLRAIGSYRDARAVPAARGFLSDEDEGTFFEAVMVMKGCGEAGLARLKETQAREAATGSDRSVLLREVIQEMEMG